MYGLWGRGKGVYTTHFILALVDMCAREGCSHHRTMHEKGPCKFPKCLCKKFFQNEIYANWHIFFDYLGKEDYIERREGPTGPYSAYPHTHYLRFDEFINFQHQEEVARKVFIDEPFAWGLDSRRSYGPMATAATSQGFQHRKTVGDLFFSTQLPSRLDKSFRETSDDMFLAVRPDPWGFHFVWIGRTVFMQHLERKYVEQTVFPHYDTNEKVETHWVDEFEQEELDEGWKEDEQLANRAIVLAKRHLDLNLQTGIKTVEIR